MWEGVDVSIFPTWVLKPSFLILLLVSQFITNDKITMSPEIPLYAYGAF